VTQVLVIGIDGFDREVVDRFLTRMPNLRSLMARGTMMPYSSVFPPDSPTCWASIYTGLNPARHGVVRFRDPIRQSHLEANLDERMVDRTFWDFVGRAGKTSCILFPHMGYPPWPIRGVMVGRTTETDIHAYHLATYPPEEASRWNFSGLKPETSAPIDMGRIVRDTKRRVAREVEVGRAILDKYPWDLGFIYFSSLDNIQHLFWMHADPEDPEYVPGNRFETVLADCHELYDREVFGRLLVDLPAGITIMVVSDHGHGRRPHKLVNVNEVLRQAGLLDARPPLSRAGVQMGLKRQLARAINRSRILGHLASRGRAGARAVFPRGLGTYNRVSQISSTSRAWVSATGGRFKAYSYAGVFVNASPSSEERDAVVERVLELLRQLRAEDGRPALEQVWRREELFAGEMLARFPDVLFKLADTVGVGSDVYRGIHGRAESHRRHSGTHRMDTPFWLVVDPPRPLDTSERAISMDVGVTICDMLGLAAPPGVDGISRMRSAQK
jgi:predicted AlkP superfamily phosphohydrolase/phosphomutase